MSSAPSWGQALNPPIYLISVLPAVGVLLTARLGTGLDMGLDTGLDNGALTALLLATLAVVLLQHGINLLNDVSDWRLGADVEKHDSWVRYHHARPRDAAVHGVLSLVAGALLGLGVLLVTGQLWILAFAAPLVVLGYLYNAGRRPLSYTRLGEWVTGLCYGPGVYGCLWLLTGQPLDVGVLSGMLAFAALAVALLLSHQPPQIDTDRAAGKNSFAVRYGVVATQRSAVGLYLIFLTAFGVTLWLHQAGIIMVLVFAITGLIGAFKCVEPGPPSPRTILVAGTLALGLALALGLILGLTQPGVLPTSV